MKTTENKCCELLLRQLDIMEMTLKQFKEMNRNLEDKITKTLDTSKIEQGIVDLEREIKLLDINNPADKES